MKDFEEKVFDDEYDDEDYINDEECDKDEEADYHDFYNEDFSKKFKRWKEVRKIFPKNLEELEERTLIEYMMEILNEYRVTEYRFYKKVNLQEKGLKTLSYRLRRMYIEIGKLMDLEKRKILELKKEFIKNNKESKEAEE